MTEPAIILMAEDNPDDVELTREALDGSKLHLELHVVSDGVEAMAFLRREGAYQSAPRPDLVLLDLNMPRMDGREVLQSIRRDPDLTMLPVVILTVSQAEEDIERAYLEHANCYVTKPVDFDEFVKVVMSIESFWFSIVKRPPRP